MLEMLVAMAQALESTVVLQQETQKAIQPSESVRGWMVSSLSNMDRQIP
ncbi:MAG TPA: hypothetical protein VLI92_01775 [Candidatus Saccharimonadales bacterium]|nr:hypothetical protein [Candidatus Saccharimonadales bacterium]